MPVCTENHFYAHVAFRPTWAVEAAEMKPWLVDILACPDPDCRGDLKVHVLEAHKEQGDPDEYEEIDAALLTCQRCGRWYPVIDGIACVLPDALRMTGKQRIEEQKFLRRWQDHIDPSIIERGRPFGLETEEQ